MGTLAQSSIDGLSSTVRSINNRLGSQDRPLKAESCGLVDNVPVVASRQSTVELNLISSTRRSDLATTGAPQTVMEKHISWPTDSKLLLGVLTKIVALMRENGLSIRQIYARNAPRMAQKIGRYAHAKQFKRMRRLLKALSTRLGRVVRELERQLDQLDELIKLQAKHLIAQAKQIIEQTQIRQSKNKLCSLHEPDVDCIAKGKARQRYEFGVKVGMLCPRLFLAVLRLITSATPQSREYQPVACQL